MSEPAAHNITVLQTLQLLDAKFATSVDALATGNFAIWIGSGISRDRFPMLGGLIVKVLEFLRSNANLDDPACPYTKALDEALGLVVLDKDQIASLDQSLPAEDWAPIETIIARLSTQYSDFLNIRVGEQENDFLVVRGIDVVGTYGDPDTEPDTEHLCLAALICEGVVVDVASANWDGLVEKAFMALTDDAQGLAVCVVSRHLQDQGVKPKLIKFHGCTAHARESPQEFEPLIIARSAQIANWGTGPETTAIKEYLHGLLGRSRILMLGLSAQDYNIQKLFQDARDSLDWDWDPASPAYLFSEDKLGGKQDDLLENVYPNDYNGAARDGIQAASVIRAYAKSLLLALLLQVNTQKLLTLALHVPLPDGAVCRDWIEDGLKALRDRIADLDPEDAGGRLAFAQSILRSASRLRRLIVTGSYDPNETIYRPVKTATTAAMAADPDVKDSGLPEASVALAVIGQGDKVAIWSVRTADDGDEVAASFGLEKPDSVTPIFLAANDMAVNRLYANGSIDELSDAVLVHSQDVPPRQQRSSGRSVFSRTGAPGLREISMGALVARSQSLEDLFERFRQEASL